MEGKLATLRGRLSGMGSVLVAFSGGVDSTFLLWAALSSLGPEKVLAATASSPICFRAETERAAALAAQLGARHRFVPTGQMQDARFIENPADRCYHCKRETLGQLVAMSRQEGLAWVVEGSNRDDREEYRPGSRAVRELDVQSPLEDVGLTKAEIRALSQRAGLPTWDKKSQTCLATRFPHDRPITIEGLEQVERAEAVVGSFGFSTVRVRHHGNMARLEVPADELPILLAPTAAAHIVEALKELGYRYVVADLEGYRPGSLEESPGSAG